MRKFITVIMALLLVTISVSLVFANDVETPEVPNQLMIQGDPSPEDFD